MVQESWFRSHGSVVQESWFRSHGSGVMVQESWFRSHGSGVMVQESWFRSHGSGVMVQESWFRSHGSGVMVQESWFRSHGSGVMVQESWFRSHKNAFRSWFMDGNYCRNIKKPHRPIGRGVYYIVTAFHLLARSDRSSQAAVVHTISRVPKGLTQLDATTENLDFVGTAGRGVRRHELLILLRHEIFIVTVT